QAERARPPLHRTGDLGRAVRALATLGLLSPQDIGSEGEDAGFGVHRWTATALAGLAPEATMEAHHRAARYWSWQVDFIPQSMRDQVAQTVEARYHFRGSGELDQALGATDRAGNQLMTWGAYAWAEQLYRETLTWIP